MDISGIKQSKLPNLKLTKNKECKFKNSSVKRIRDKVSLYHADKINIVRYRSSYSLYQASFSINQHPFVLFSQDRSFYSEHNIFIADGDDIEVFYLQSEDKDSLPIILGVYNYTDNGAYLISGQFYIGHQRAKKSIYWILGGVTAFIFSILFFFSVSNIYDNGNYWDKWDWLSIADMFLFFGIIYFCIVSGIAFLISLLSNLYISSSD
ncbi:hypothetical protein, partial [Proteus myxofaciens]|uniref:hypothetical protein n=1 Tax=Proteus myxofaciens TaxID=184072 RepID=UPI0012ECF552